MPDHPLAKLALILIGVALLLPFVAQAQSDRNTQGNPQGRVAHRRTQDRSQHHTQPGADRDRHGKAQRTPFVL